MKKIKSLTIAIMLVISLFITSTQAADMIAVDLTASKDSAAAAATISDALRERLVEAEEDERIPVTIELTDNIDLEKVDQRALARAQLSSAELAIMNVDTSTFSEEINEAHQKMMLELHDEIAVQKQAILKEHYSNKTAVFLSSAGLTKAEYGSIGIFTPFISNILLTPVQIQKLSASPEVVYIDYLGGVEDTDFDSIENTYRIINGNVAVDEGYTGGGIRVGLVESGVPKRSIMGNDAQNILRTNSTNETEHAALTSGIIKKMAPGCTIYARAMTTATIIDDIETLIDKYNVHVVNVSCGALSEGVYTTRSRRLDQLVKRTGVAIVVSSGNGNPSSDYINDLALAPNVIAVGAVNSSGTNPGAARAYMQTNYSIYRENIKTVNKPDVCAPGQILMYSLIAEGTSFSAPHVTGTIVQMIARNSGLRDKPQTLKAALMASASYNYGSSMSYVTNTRASDQEGAGVIDAGFCYQVARNSRRTHFDATVNSTSFEKNVYCDYTTIPFRIACAWEALSTGSTTSISDYDMKVYKNGTLVASSSAFTISSENPKSNYEIIEIGTATLEKYGAGYYQVKITRSGGFSGDVTQTVRIGLAWEQR
ncbi:MAG: S8 family serine peptidase [Butyrivibrio sp.]|nr:S8 family serine peptidase [Butyrivibrio sp.]